MGIFSKLKENLTKTKMEFQDKINNIFGKNKNIDDIIEDLEEALILSDVSALTSSMICEKLRTKLIYETDKSEENIKEILKKEIIDILKSYKEVEEKENNREVILVVGVNGVGKTTTIAKLANIYIKQGKKVLLAAGDTFRAGAIEQLQIWADRCNCDMISGKANSDPSSVIFDASKKFKEDLSYDVLICDTAGRLHNKSNLMEELFKIKNTIYKNMPDIFVKTYIVLDGATGNNALIQAKTFNEKIEINGIIVTKLDSTAKGGALIGIVNELKVPIKYVGVGEKIDDIEVFDANLFVTGLF